MKRALVFSILLASCAPRVVYRTAPRESYSVVTFRVPHRNWFDDTGVKFRRQEERFENSAAARDFVQSFTAEERRILDVQQSDIVVTETKTTGGKP